MRGKNRMEIDPESPGKSRKAPERSVWLRMDSKEMRGG
jgi:hypothetical protein